MTQVYVPWWILPLILTFLAIVAWIIIPKLHEGQDPDDWWEERMAKYSLEEAERMADEFRELANSLRKAMDMEVAKNLAKKLEAKRLEDLDGVP